MKYITSLLTFLLFSSFALSQTQLGADIDGEAEGDYSGWSVSMSSNGSRLAIGALNNDGSGNNSGHVRVYEYANSAWTQLGADIDGEAAGDQSGYSVSMSSDGSRLAIGATSNDGSGNNSGHVRVYEYASGAWTMLGAEFNGEAAYDLSGISVSMSSDGSRLAIGANSNDGSGNNSGHVRVYEYANSAWTQLGADIDGEAAGDQSGVSVSMSSDGSRVAIGAAGNDENGSFSGHVRVYEYASGAWTQLAADIDGEAAGDQSGYSVSMSSDGSRVAIGALGNDGSGNNSGHVRVYEYANSAWTQLGADIDGEAAGDQSGYSVSMSSDGSRVAIGALSNDGSGNNSGHVRVYEYASGAWTMLGAEFNGEADGDQSGLSVSMSSDGSRLAIGAYGNDGNGNASGHVRVYLTNPGQVTFQPQNLDELKTAVNLWTSDKTTALSTYGEINTWDVSVITDMNTLFQNKGSFNSDISSWNVSNVSTMLGMFRGAKSFNQDISSWNVSKVTTFGATFHNADSFNRDISSWDVSSATNMNNMFQETNNFNQDISGWDISGVTTMNDIFTGADALSDKNKCAIHTKFSSNANWSYDWSSSCITFQPKTREELQTAVDLWVSDNVTALSTYGEINTWDVSLITDMSDLFKDKSTFNGDISNWDVSNVTSFRQIFYGAKTFNQDISNWNVSGAKNMWRSFSHASSFNQDISNWNVSSVTNMYRMFDTAKTFNQDISNWDVSNVTRMYRMFRDAESFNQDISKWGSKLSKVTDMNGMFLSANTFNQDISNWDVSNVRDMESMFRFATSFNQDISGWNVSNVTNMKDMFGTASDANALSNQNKCAIHTSFQSNDAWPYVWSDSCPGLFKNKSPISLSPYPTSIESDDYTIDANGILDKPINWSFPAISDTGDIIDFIVGSDWHSKRPKDLQILYGKKVIATWTHPSKDSGGCAKDLDDYLQNGLTISASDCDTSTPSFSTGVLKMKLDISEADSLKLRILSAWEENGILFNGAWIRTGIYGHAESSALYVSALGSDLTGDGTSGNPFYTIQKGINHSKDGDSVLVYAGTYVENIDFTGKKISVIGENKFRTIIDGDSSGTVVTIESGEDSTTLLKAFMIRNGIAKNGGGIKITNKSNPVINHVIVHDNRSHTNGGGIYINNARASISNTIIRGNNSDGVAGGLYIGEGAEVTVSYAQIINNVAAVRGGGIFVRKHTTSFNLKYALISHNSSYEGGGIGSWYASSNLSNITFVGNNSTTNRGHAIFLRDGAQMVLENSIVMGTESNVIYLEDPESSLSATYSMIEKGWEGEGNIIADPLFCNLEIGNHISQLRNYSLWENSPCLGTGKDGANMGAFDMGCDSPKPFEWISSAVDTINLTTSNLTEIYKLEWAKSNNQFGDLHYKVYASIGSTPYDEIHDTTATNFPITYQEFLEGAFEPFPMLSSATVKFSVVAIEGTDTIKVTGGDRVVYVNRYEYLSTNSSAIPTKFALYENYPNPFNPTTTLRFDLPEVSDVSLVIYNMLGQKVRTFNMKSISAGTHSIKWNATNDLGESVSAGVYLYQFQAKGFVKNRKMVLLK